MQGLQVTARKKKSLASWEVVKASVSSSTPFPHLPAAASFVNEDIVPGCLGTPLPAQAGIQTRARNLLVHEHEREKLSIPLARSRCQALSHIRARARERERVRKKHFVCFVCYKAFIFKGSYIESVYDV